MQWRCNQCSHQWGFANLEERAVVPRHLTGGRVEQFLEKFLAIKALTKSEAEKIWNGCFKVHQMISVAANDEKRQVFLEQFEIWRDQLIELQETLIVDRLLPLVIEYQIIENEQMWLLEAFQQAWKPVTAGYWEWLTVVVRGHPSGIAVDAIPNWGWQLRGAPRNVAPLEMGSEKKVSTHYGHLVDELQSDLVVHREGAIAKAFLAGKTSRPSTVDSWRERRPESSETESAEIQSASRRQEPALMTAPHNLGGNSTQETSVSGEAADEKVTSTIRRKRTTRPKPPCFEAAVDQLKRNLELTPIEFCQLMDRKADQYPTSQKYRPPKRWKVRSFLAQYEIRRNTISRFLHSVRKAIRSEGG
jgi:hypothetical protein